MPPEGFDREASKGRVLRHLGGFCFIGVGLMGEDEPGTVCTLEAYQEHQRRKEDEHGSQNHH